MGALDPVALWDHTEAPLGRDYGRASFLYEHTLYQISCPLLVSASAVILSAPDRIIHLCDAKLHGKIDLYSFSCFPCVCSRVEADVLGMYICLYVHISCIYRPIVMNVFTLYLLSCGITMPQRGTPQEGRRDEIKHCA